MLQCVLVVPCMFVGWFVNQMIVSSALSIYMYVCEYIYVYMCVCIYMCKYIYVYVYIYVYMYKLEITFVEGRISRKSAPYSFDIIN